MQTLLADIECDMLELKSLLQMASTNDDPTLRRAVGRCIRRMQTGLNELETRLDELPMIQEETLVAHEKEPAPETAVHEEEKTMPRETPVTDNSATVAGSVVHQATPSILAECIRPAADLRHALSLNDRFRFTRELFGGDAARMDETMQHISEAASLQEALDRVMSDLRPDESNEAVADFVELLKKYFK